MTKFSLLFLSAFGLLLLASGSASAITPEYNTYLRAGTGANGAGGSQQCVQNKGSSGNEFRLGNECGIYGEFMVSAPLVKAADEDAPYWKVFSDFAFAYNNRSLWENRWSIDKDNNRAYTSNWVLTELYTEAGNVDGMTFSVWAGKRYYRWSDVHMMDFYPVNFSGPGGGIGDIELGSGILHVAVMQYAGSDELSSLTATPAGSDQDVDTEIGKAAKTSLHLRLEQVEFSGGFWSFWLAGATTPSTKNTTGTRNYKSTTGSFIAAKNNMGGDKFSNEFGVAYGHSNLSNMWTGGELIVDCANTSSAECTVHKSNRIRAWENFTVDNGTWTTQLAAIYDEYDKGTENNSKVRRMSLGVRPIHWFSDHIGLAFETGISNILDDSDGLGSRNLGRLTVAPQLSMGRGYYSRPVLRAYYTKTFWSENNKVSAAGTVAKDDTSIDAFGLQTEVWF